MAIGQYNQSNNYRQRQLELGLDGNYERSVYDNIEQERLTRSGLNDKWIQLWHLYKTKPLRVESEGEWHSKLNDGKVFEVVETVGSYIRNALFYSDQWVNLEAREPGLAEIVPIANSFFIDSLNSSNFKREFRVYLVQLLLTGNSAMNVTWDKDLGLIFETLPIHNTYVDSSRRFDSRFSFSYYETQMNYPEFLSMWSKFNELEIDDPEAAFDTLANSTESEDIEKVNLRDTIKPVSERLINLVQYYCPIEGELYYMVNDVCIGCHEVKDCPWTFASLFETPESAYGMSLIESSIGMILEDNVLMNRRLDNIAVSVDNMWLFVDDGVTNPDDIRTQPGKVIVVGRPDSLTPLHPPANNFNVTYTEAQMLEQKIDRNIGTGAGISANAYRTGERVTATEIRSVKDAGGNRLTDLYEHVEATAILPILYKAYELLKKNTKKKTIVKLSNNSEPGNAGYFEMLPQDLRYDYRVRLSATQSIINRDRNIQLLTDFLTLTANVPQFQQMINYQNLFYDLLVKFGFDDPGRYIMQQQPQQPGEAPAAPETGMPTTPLSEANATMEDIAPGANVMQGLQASGQLPELMNQLATGTPPTEGEPLDDNMNTMLTGLANAPM